jgi:hypothetical protein
MSQINEKSLHFSENNIKNLGFFEKTSHHFKKSSILLKMSSKRLLFLIKAPNLWKCPQKAS